MRSPKRLAVAVVAILTVVAAAYVGTQYRLARHPSSLAALPQYPFQDSAYPIKSLTEQERISAEAALQGLAHSVKPNYHPTAVLMLAAKGVFIWDAVRATTGSYLSDNGFHIESVGQRPHSDADPAYILWARADRLLNFFSDKQILAVGLQNPIRPALPADQVHVYAYFALSPGATGER